MRTIYFLTLSVHHGNEPAVLLDIEFPDVPTLNAMLTEIHDADLEAYVLVTSGEREISFYHNPGGDSLAAEFRAAVKAARAGDSLAIPTCHVPQDVEPNAEFARLLLSRRETTIAQLKREDTRVAVLTALFMIASVVAIGWYFA